MCDFFLAETVSSIKVEQGDFAAEEWENAVCGYLDGWPPAGATKGEGVDVDCLVAHVAVGPTVYSHHILGYTPQLRLNSSCFTVHHQ